MDQVDHTLDREVLSYGATTPISDPHSDCELQVSIEVITPDQAETLLLKNSEMQRRLDMAVVEKYAHDMSAGLWIAANGEAIKLSDSGTIIDGQHRLNAVVKAGVPVHMMVIRGVHEDNISTIDAGKSRTFADTLAIEGESVSNKNVTAVVCRKIYSIQHILQRGTIHKIRDGMRVSNTTLLSYVRKNPGLLESISEFNDLFKAKEISKTMTLTAAVTFWVIASRIDRKAAHAILMTIETGFPFEDTRGNNSPAFQLYKTLMIYKTQRDRKRLAMNDYLDFLSVVFEKHLINEELRTFKMIPYKHYFYKKFAYRPTVSSMFELV